MTSRKRSKVIIFNPKAPTGKTKRPDHPDFRTTEEHKKAKFTGIRQNQMSLEWEFWILGNIEKRVTFKEVQLDKNALTKAHVELFALEPPPGIFDPNKPQIIRGL